MAIYYVRPNGNNANAGTGPLTTQAWATPVYAALHMLAGDKCYIAPGFYVGGIVFDSSGSSVSKITLEGDPKALQFSGMAPGEVIIAQRSGVHGNVLYSGATVAYGTKVYTEIKNITLEAGSGPVLTGGANTAGTNNLLVNCKVYGNISGFITAGLVSSLIANQCEFYRTEISTSYALTFDHCYFANLQMNLGSLASTVNFIQCVINLSTVLLSSSTATTANSVDFEGCKIKAGNGGTSVAGYVITIPSGSATKLMFNSCIIEGACKFIDFFSYSNAGRLYTSKCHIRHMQLFYKKGVSTGAQTLLNLNFEGMIQCVEATSATYPMVVTNATLDKCVMYGSANVTFMAPVISYGGNSNGAVLNTPSYRLPVEDEKYPTAISSVAVPTPDPPSTKPVFNVVNYGAVANGSTDCRTAINNAITAASAVAAPGGIVYFPPATGNYLISNYVTLKSNIEIQGYGATVYRAPVASAAGIMFYKSTAEPDITNITIKGLTLKSANTSTGTGEYAGSLTSYIEGISITRFNGLTIKDVNMDSLYMGLKLQPPPSGQNQNVLVDNLNVYNTRNPLYMEATKNIEVKNSILDASGGGTKYLHAMYVRSNCSDAVFNNVKFRNTPGGGIHLFTEGGIGATRFTFNNCETDESRVGVYLYSGCSYITFNNLKIKNAGLGIKAYGASNIVIDGLTMTDCSQGKEEVGGFVGSSFYGQVDNVSIDAATMESFVWNCVGTVDVTCDNFNLTNGGGVDFTTNSGSLATITNKNIEIDSSLLTDYVITGDADPVIPDPPPIDEEGFKGLKLKGGYEYPVVFDMFVDCEAGVPRTMTFKYKTQAAGRRIVVKLGDTGTFENANTNGLEQTATTAPYTHYTTEKVRAYILCYIPLGEYIIIGDIEFL